jgi:hypothetical protein
VGGEPVKLITRLLPVVYIVALVGVLEYLMFQAREILIAAAGYDTAVVMSSLIVVLALAVVVWGCAYIHSVRIVIKAEAPDFEVSR